MPLGDLHLTSIPARHRIRTYQQRGNSQVAAQPLGSPESLPEDHAPLRRDGHPHTSDDVRPGWRSVQHRLLGPQSSIEALPDEMLAMAVRDRHADRKSTRLNSSHVSISYAVFCLKKKKYIAL